MGEWYALMIEPGRERRLIDWLRHVQNYAEVYWPNYPAKVRLSRHRKGMRRRGVLPGYMFIRSIHDHVPLSFRRITDHSLVYGVLRSGEHAYARIKPEQIERIRAVEDALNAGGRDDVPFKVGQKVRIINELWSNFVTKIKRIDNPGRVVIECGLFGRSVDITLPSSEIVAV